jgi:hypothetical protein
MEPITLLQSFELERRLAAGGASPAPRAQHLAEARARRATMRRDRVRTWAAGLVPTRQPVATPEPCGC